MAKNTRLASTLIARYYPSKTYTDAFYLDGRLFGKRETRQADITIDKDEKGFFLSVFSHPSIAGYEPGMIPPYEPQLRGICNEVKFGRKPIDSMISGFLSTAVEVTGKMKLQDPDSRAPYFSGIIVHDAEAFAVTIGSGLAFLYRNDTLYPMTDAGIPMEPIDAFGNRVGDFYNYVSSKTANALWSNITTLSVDDCIILCNKAVYDALGQKELLRILDEADDQCDAAGTVITQASANMPETPMQFSISFVESITADEKKGLFGFRKKNKEEDVSNMSIKSTMEGGIIGAAAEAVAGAGFVAGVNDPIPEEEIPAGVAFGDDEMPESAKIPDVEGFDFSSFVVPDTPSVSEEKAPVEFLDKSAEPKSVEEIPVDEMMKSLFGEMDQSKKEGLEIQKKAEEEAAAAASVPTVDEKAIPLAPAMEEGTTITPAQPEIPSDSPFVSAFNPFAAASEVEPSVMEPVSETPFESKEDESMMDTKTVSSFDSLFANQVKNESGIASDGIIAAALRELKEEADQKDDEEEIDIPQFPVTELSAPEGENEEKVPEVETSGDEIIFGMGEASEDFDSDDKALDKPFDPYNAGNAEEMQSVGAVMYPDDKFTGFTLGDDDKNDKENGGDPEMSDNDNADVNEPSFDWKETGSPNEPLVDSVPAPEYDIDPENKETNPIDNVNFPLSGSSEPAPSVTPAPAEAAPAPSGEFVIPFENAVYAEPEPSKQNDGDIPDMPVYGSQSYDAPTYAVNSEETLSDESGTSYAVGEYVENEDMAPQRAPYQSFGSESFDPSTSTEQYADYVEDQQAAPGYDNGYASQGYDDQGYAAPDQGYADQQAYGDQYASAGYEGQEYAGQYSQQGYDNGAYSEPAYEQFSDPNQGYNARDYNSQGYEQFEDPNAGNYGQNAYYDNQQAAAAAAAGTASAAAAAAAASASSSASAGDEWINNILGLDGDGNPTSSAYGSNSTQAPTRPGNRTAPSGQQRARQGNNPQRRPQPGAPRQGGNGGSRGGNGGGAKPFKLSRNGAIFLIFVAVLLIALIVIISLIIKSCTADDKTKETESTSETTVETTTVPTTAAPTEPDPTEKIGVFVFSEYTGYRTWWDLFNQVYNIQITGDDDPHIAIICKYNNAPEGYKPQPNEWLYLPPVGVIDGTIPLEGSIAETTPAETGEVEGTPSVGGETDATTTEAAGETTTTAAAETPAT